MTTTASSKINSRSSKRATTTITHHTDPLLRTTRTKHHAEYSHQSTAKPDSGSDDVHTAPLINESISKHHEIVEDIDEESTGIHAIQSSPERYSSNNSAVRLQQQAMGDHYHLHSKQHRIRNKISSKSPNEFNENDLTYWRLFLYLLTIVLLAFVIYRFLIAIWPKPKKTMFEQIIDNLSKFFTL